jgi:hypothetical protein
VGDCALAELAALIGMLRKGRQFGTPWEISKELNGKLKLSPPLSFSLSASFFSLSFQSSLSHFSLPSYSISYLKIQFQPLGL